VDRIGFALLAVIGLLAITVPLAVARSSSRVVGNPVTGKAIFIKKCAPCHTLKAAGAAGRVGPNLDRLKPSYAAVVTQVTTGGSGPPPGMKPTFMAGEFTAAQVRDIAAFVFISTHPRAR